MKKTVKVILLSFSLVLTLSVLNSCSNEREYLEQSLNNRRSSATYLKGVKAEKIINTLNSRLENTILSNSINRNNREATTNIGTIDFSKILEVIDSRGVKNYTFKVINHPEADAKTFFNFIMNVKDSTNYSLHLLKYKMNDTFFEEFVNGTKKIGEFNGTISNYKITQVIECEDEVIVSQPPLIVPGGSNLGGGSAGGGGWYGGSGINVPFVAEDSNATSGCWGYVQIPCCKGVHYGEFDGCECGDTGEFKGATFLADFCGGVAYQVYKENNYPCLPEGDVGIIDEFVVTPCDELNKLFNIPKPDIKSTIINDLRPDILINPRGEKAAFLQKTPDGTLGTSLGNPSTNNTTGIRVGSNFYSAIHTHPNSCYPMFTWGDVFALYTINKNIQDHNAGMASFMLVCQDVNGIFQTYAIVLNNETINMIELILSSPGFSGMTKDEIAKMKDMENLDFEKEETDGTHNYEKAFLDLMSNINISLYKADESLSSWTELVLNTATNQIITKPCE